MAGILLGRKACLSHDHLNQIQQTYEHTLINISETPPVTLKLIMKH